MKILLVEDEPKTGEYLRQGLSEAGFVVDWTQDGAEGLNLALQSFYDLVILDVMLPDSDGFEMCRKIRATNDVPILMLTAKGEETDRIVGLELGADDYMPKPFSPRELLARLKAILRRSQGPSAPQSEIMRFGNLEIDLGSRSVRLDTKDFALTSYQFDILVALAKNAGRVLSRDQLMDLVKGEELEAFDRTIDVHISRIRSLIETDPKHPKRIITVRGAGYVFARIQEK